MRNAQELKLLIAIAKEAYQGSLTDFECSLIRDGFKNLNDADYIKLLCDLRFRAISKDNLFKMISSKVQAIA